MGKWRVQHGSDALHQLKILLSDGWRQHGGAGPKEEQEGDMEDGCQGQVSGSGRGQRGLFGTRQKVTFQASAALCVGLPGGRSESTFPGGKQACEHQAQD